MGIKIDFEKKLIVNGREGHSWEEVPEAVRRLGGSALSPAGGQSVIFNGKEYADVTAMPEEERRLFETIMQTIRTEGGTPAGDAAAVKNQGGGNITLSLDSYRKGKSDSPSLISRLTLWGAIIIVLLWGVYRLLQ